MTLDELNRLPVAEARAAFERCCGAGEWIERMVAARPFSGAADLYDVAGRAAATLTERDWREAFAHHPKIGDRESLARRFGSTAVWASQEQQGAAAATAGTLDALAEGNRAYEEKFGYIFIVCATGRSAEEMLALLRARLPNDPGRELAIAAEEQMKITRLRLEKLLAGPA